MNYPNRDFVNRPLELMPVTVRNGACNSKEKPSSPLTAVNLPGVIYSAIVHADGTRNFVYLSEGIYELSGLHPHEAIAHSKPMAALIHPEDRVSFESALKLAELSFTDFCHDYRLITTTKTVRWVHEQARLSRQATGEIVMDGIILPVPNRTTLNNSLRPTIVKSKTRTRRTGNLRQTVDRIAKRIHQSLILEDIVNVTVTEVQRLMGVDRAIIAHWESCNSLVNIGEAVNPSYSSILQLKGTHPWMQGQSEPYQQECYQVIDDLDQLELSSEAVAEIQRQHLKAAIAIPIWVQEKLWGMLIVHQCDAPRTWQLRDLETLKQLASQLEIAIYHAGLYHQLHRSNMELERKFQLRNAQLQLAFEFEATLKRITDKVRDSLDENQILQAAVHELTKAIGVRDCNAALYDLDKGTSTICYEYTTSDNSYYGRVAHINAFPEIYDQLLRGRVFQFCSIVPNPVRGPVSMLACPIMDDQEVLGDLWLINHKFYAFSEQDIRLVQLVASQCAIALRQARLYKAAQAQVAELARLNQLKDDFLSTVSHELRTPIASIKMASQMLEITLNKIGLLEEKSNPTARYLQILQGECNREINLVNDLLNLSRLEAKVELTNPAPIPLQEWVTELVKPFIEQTKKQNQRFEVGPIAESATVVTDVSLLERVVTELLQNACKYTPTQEHIGFDVLLEQKTLIVSVTNSGVEIPVQEQSRIFEKFYRIPNVKDRWKHGGTGLGLALVKKLVEQLHGSIAVKSLAQQTCFVVEIPVELA